MTRTRINAEFTHRHSMADYSVLSIVSMTLAMMAFFFGVVALLA